jgi:Cu-processing system permease protein
MNRTFAIAINTFREAVRDKVLYGVVGLASSLLIFTLALAELSLNQQSRVVADVGLASISFFAIVVAVFLGSSLLYKEIERKTLYVILPKPIERWEFLVGKFLGIALTGTVFVGIMGAIQLWVASVQAGIGAPILIGGTLVTIGVFALGFYVRRDASAILVPWAVAAFVIAALACSRTNTEMAPIVAQLALIVVELTVTASVALLFSSFSTPFLTGAFTVGVWILGRSADAMIAMPARAVPPQIKSLLSVLAWIVPNNDLFAPGRHALVAATATHGSPLLYVVEATGYGLCYVLVMLVASSVIFARRDFA